LTGLLVTSGVWAAAECGLLLLPGTQAKVVSYIIGLVAGLATVGAWLYFCSAYTGHEYHRQPTLRRLAIGVYAAIVLVKITNPVHNLYFTSTLVPDPFPHLAITLLPAHWVVTGLSYALTAVGFYLLYELFAESQFDTRAVGALVAVTALPVIFDLFSYTSSLVLSLNYEPLGVAIFAVGVLYVVDEQFVALPAFWRQEILEALNDPVIAVDQAGAVRDYNRAAADAFPKLPSIVGKGVGTEYPELAKTLTNAASPIEVSIEDETRYYVVERRKLSIKTVVFGRVIILSDITTIERQRRELQRQNDQFDEFSDAITHELRNTLAIADGYLKMVGDELTQGDSLISAEYFQKTSQSLDRMDSIVTDLSKLARFGQTLDATATHDIAETVNEGWNEADTEGMSLTVESEGMIHADRIRLVDLFCSVFEFARFTGTTNVTVGFHEGVIEICTDGRELTPEEVERAFEYGEAIPTAEAGMLLPSIQTIAAVHGWAVSADEEYEGGVCIHIITSEFEY
jgi:signal transduction histidine kinase